MAEGRDGLTGLLNRRSFEEVLTSAVSEGRTFTLALADVKGLKRLNDRFGMRFADEVLRGVGRGLYSFPGEGAARIGGDEFALIVEGADPDAAVKLSNHLSSAADVPVTVGDFSTTLAAFVGKITVAVGAAMAPAEAIEATALVEIADRRLRDVQSR